MSVPSKKIDIQVEELSKAISGNYVHLSRKGYKMNMKMGIFVTVSAEIIACGRGMEYIECITQLPDGRYFSWTWESNLHNQKLSRGPAAFFSNFLVEVHHIVVDEWVTGGPSETIKALN